MAEELSLKWGTLKGWRLNPEGPAMAALRRWHDAGEVCLSSMQQRDNPDQVEAMCEIIDALDADTVYLAWDGRDVDKETAKTYLREYKR